MVEAIILLLIMIIITSNRKKGFIVKQENGCKKPDIYPAPQKPDKNKKILEKI